MATRNPRNKQGTQPPSGKRAQSSQAKSSQAQSSRSPSTMGPSSAAAKAHLLQKATAGRQSSAKSTATDVSSASFTSASLPSTTPDPSAKSESMKRIPMRSFVPKGGRRPSQDGQENEARGPLAQNRARDGADTEQQRLAVNAAFMWEIKSVNEDLWLVIELLHTMCRRPHLIPQRGKRMVGLLEQFLDLVAMQFTLEEAYGYFDDPEHVEATFSAQAIDLRDEHVVLYESLMGLVDRAQEYFFASDFSAMTYRLPASISAFIEQFQAHDRRECELTMTAMNVDLGVGD